MDTAPRLHQQIYIQCLIRSVGNFNLPLEKGRKRNNSFVLLKIRSGLQKLCESMFDLHARAVEKGLGEVALLNLWQVNEKTTPGIYSYPYNTDFCFKIYISTNSRNLLQSLQLLLYTVLAKEIKNLTPFPMV
jgi:hypothetical protein